jgi:lipoate-protein ligase A
VSWRLLLHPAASAADNMSIDEALLVQARRPVLRLYTWERPSVSLGYRQSPAAWLERCARAGVAVVRRVSGGGAVVHAGDLTYAVVAPLGTPGVPGDLRGSFEWIREALLAALRQAGLDARRGAPRSGADRLEICFAGATGFEVELAGRKLVGSAQRRTSRAFLQHGSIRLADDGALYRELLDLDPPLPAADVSAQRARGAIVEAFERALGEPLEPSELDSGERAEQLRRTRLRARDPLLAPPLVSSRFLPSADRHA